MKVYVAFSGEYTDRVACAVFTDKAKADESSDDVDEFELDGDKDWSTQKIYSVSLYASDGSQRGTPNTRMEFCQPNLRTGKVHGYYGWAYGFSTGMVEQEAAHADDDGLVNFALGESTQSFDEALTLADGARQEWLRQRAGETFSS